MAITVKALAEQLGISGFTLAGSSMGGAVALRYSLMYPANVHALVLVDPAGVTYSGPTNVQSDPPYIFTVAHTWWAKYIFNNFTPRSIVAEGLEKSFFDQSVITKFMITRYHDLARYPGSREATRLRFLHYAAAGAGYRR